MKRILITICAGLIPLILAWALGWNGERGEMAFFTLFCSLYACIFVQMHFIEV